MHRSLHLLSPAFPFLCIVYLTLLYTSICPLLLYIPPFTFPCITLWCVVFGSLIYYVEMDCSVNRQSNDSRFTLLYFPWCSTLAIVKIQV
jgi:hypothetical protein